MIDLKSPSKINIREIKTGKLIENTYIWKPFDLMSQLKNISTSTLILHGDVDPFPLETVEHIQKAIPQSTLVVFKKCSHFPYIEKSKEFFETVEIFLK